MSFRGRTLTVVAIATAMAYLESAVVVYLQRAQSIDPDKLFPLQQPQALGNLAAIEVGREFATLVMLAGLGILVGRRALDRLAWCAVAFGVWDVFYYVWLWLFIGWPHSPLTWDVLFLIPVPWVGPVWAPLMVSAALVGFGLAAARQVERGRELRASWSRIGLGLGGGLLVIASFTWDAPRLLSGGTPAGYPWPVFVAGMALAAWGAVAVLRGGAGETRFERAGRASDSQNGTHGRVLANWHARDRDDDDDRRERPDRLQRAPDPPSQAGRAATRRGA
jgi:hypothetical protein